MFSILFFSTILHPTLAQNVIFMDQQLRCYQDCIDLGYTFCPHRSEPNGYCFRGNVDANLMDGVEYIRNECSDAFTQMENF